MSLESFLRRVLNESNEHEDDDYMAVAEIYDDGDMCPDEEWNEETHSKNEAVKKVRVIRNGIPTFIARSTRPGYKVAHGEERKMSFAERRARERAAERTYVRKKKWQSDKLQADRKASIKKRKDFGIEKDEEE